MSKVREYLNSLPEEWRANLPGYEIIKRGDTMYEAYVGLNRLSEWTSGECVWTSLEYAQDAIVEKYKREIGLRYPNIVESWKP